MSHYPLGIKFNDGDIWYGEYNGTADVTCPQIFATSDKMAEMWRRHSWDNMCSCKGERVEVTGHYDVQEGKFIFIGDEDALACREHGYILYRNVDEGWQ
jgi:hypothetical protein